mgnify:CR=1 FL=1
MVILDRDPALGIGAVERGERRLPLARGLVALGLVAAISSSSELRAVNVVGKTCPLRG